MGASVTRNRERVEIRTAAVEHECWSWGEKCKAPGEGWDGNPPCTRVIDAGERYVVSTIFPGHDSGYADDRMKWHGAGWVPVPSSPISSAFCIPCARRWTNLSRLLVELDPWAVPAC